MRSTVKMTFFTNFCLADAAILKMQFVLLEVLEYSVSVFALERNWLLRIVYFQVCKAVLHDVFTDNILKFDSICDFQIWGLGRAENRGLHFFWACWRVGSAFGRYFRWYRGSDLLHADGDLGLSEPLVDWVHEQKLLLPDREQVLRCNFAKISCVYFRCREGLLVHDKTVHLERCGSCLAHQVERAETLRSLRILLW